MSGGVRAAKFENVGDFVQGAILSSEVRDQTDIQTGEVKRFKNGDPMRQVVITIMTDPMVQEDDEDDGLRRIYVKSQMTSALRDACRLAGVRGPADGGKIRVTFVGTKPPTTRGFSPTKLYEIKYREPERRADLEDAGLDEEAAPF